MAFHYASSAAAALAIAMFLVVPESAWWSLPHVCLIRNLFGAECLGCGMTRALSAMAHGHIESAFALNRGVSVVAPMLVATVLQGLRIPR